MKDGLTAPGDSAAEALDAGASRAAGPAIHIRTPQWTMGEKMRRGFVGTFVARPWFDTATLLALKHMFFPSARLWAAEQEAAGNTDQFYAAVPMPVRHEHKDKLGHALANVEQARVASRAIEQEWQRVFFGPDETGVEHRQAVEAARLTLRHAYNGMRFGLRAHAPWNIPRAKLAIATPDAVEAVHGGGLDAFNAKIRLPSTLPKIEQSRLIPTAQGRDYWLRFQSPSQRLGDTVYARVHEPHDVDDKTPTIICGHGICVDFDHWKGLIDESQRLLDRGFRIVRPEAPWHGRRAPLGHYGGERTIGAFPMGMLDSFAGALQEWAVLSHWARQRSKGALVFGGSSLGAMTSQLAADRSSEWPAEIRPNALFLVTHTGDMGAAIMEGALAHLWAKPEDVKKFGWTPELARKYLSLVNPVNTMPMPAHHIVSILGRRDVILPFESGRQLVARWGVPEKTAFIWDRGHFSVPASLIRNTAPLDRLAEIATEYR